MRRNYKFAWNSCSLSALLDSHIRSIFAVRFHVMCNGPVWGDKSTWSSNCGLAFGLEILPWQFILFPANTSVCVHPAEYLAKLY